MKVEIKTNLGKTDIFKSKISDVLEGSCIKSFVLDDFFFINNIIFVVKCTINNERRRLGIRTGHDDFVFIKSLDEGTPSYNKAIKQLILKTLKKRYDTNIWKTKN